MNKKFKFITMLCMALLLVIAGCSSGSSNNTPNPQTSTTAPKATDADKPAEDADSSSNLTAPGAFPIVKKPVTLTVLVAGDARVEDMATNAATKWYEEKTNVHINWEIAPEGSIPETLNLRLASGDFPDIFMSMGVTRAQEMIYGQQGAFLPLNDLIKNQGYYINQMFDAKPEYHDAIVAPDGNIYSLPEINECYHCSMAAKMWINKDFLSVVNLPMPQTTEDYYQVLKAFKTQDPNKNGKPDEIPFIGANKGWNTQPWMFLMNSFVYSPPERIYLKDGKVTASFNQDGWLAGLKYMHQLYSEGLLAGESFTQDDQQLRQLGENPDAPIVGSFSAGWFGVGTEYGGKSERWKQYTSLSPLAGPDGTRWGVSFPYQFSSGKAVITSAAKDPEVAFRWLDGFYKEEVGTRVNMGEPGTDWVEAKPGEKGIDGRPAKWRAISSYSKVSKTQWYQKSPAYTSDDVRLSVSAGDKPEENLEVILFNQTKSNYEPYRAPIEMVLPPLFFSEEQSTEIADLQKTIIDYVDQTTARFITGDLSLDKDWQSYLDTLDSMNLKGYIKINQDAYDATKK